MPLFFRVTILVALGIVALIALAVLLKILVVAALIAAVVVAFIAVANAVQRRRSRAIVLNVRR
jgi:hypothetical protein